MKKILTLCMLAGMTGAAFTACDDEEDYTPKAPEVNILNVNSVNICKPEETVSLKAQINETIATQLQWTVNGQNEGQDTLYAFSSPEVGIFNVKLTASNKSGVDADSISIMVTKVTSINDITNWTGEEGSNRAVLAIQWVTADCEDIRNPEADKVFFRAWGYRWDEGEEKTSVDMVKAIAQNDPRFFAVLTESDWGISATGFIYDADGDGNFEISNAAHTLTQADFTNGIYMNTPDGDFDNIIVSDGDYWIGGFMNTFLCSWNLDSSEELSTNITESQFMMNQRVLGNNSWDAWTWSWYDPANPVNPSPLLQLLEAAE